MTSFVSGKHDYLVPTTQDRGPEGLGATRSSDWASSVVEVPLHHLARAQIDCVVLQRPLEVDLCAQWLPGTLGVDIPAVYLEHNAPTQHAVQSRHQVVTDERLAHVDVVHVTWFNAMAWDCGSARTTVVEHGIPDLGLRYTGVEPSVVAVINEAVRRGRVAGTDLLIDFATHIPTYLYGIQSEQLATHLAGHDNISYSELHEKMPRHRAYLHPNRWTSLGLSLLEAMNLGMPILALSTTEAPLAVPPEAGLLSNDIRALRDQGKRWLDDPTAAREAGLAGRAYALQRYGLGRFLDDWDAVLESATV